LVDAPGNSDSAVGDSHQPIHNHTDNGVDPLADICEPVEDDLPF
jgi:hypothetical protein